VTTMNGLAITSPWLTALARAASIALAVAALGRIVASTHLHAGSAAARLSIQHAAWCAHRI